MILLTRRLRSSEGNSQSGFYFTSRSLSGHGTLLRPGCQTPTGYRSAGRTFSARRRSQGTCRLYFTDYTLTGQQNASPFRKSVAGRPRCRYWASLVQCSTSLFHQSHFDWEPKRFSDAGPAHCQAIPHAAPSVTPSSHDSRQFSFTNYTLSSTGMLLGSGCQRSVARNS
jgi:hypothetical protein